MRQAINDMTDRKLSIELKKADDGIRRGYKKIDKWDKELERLRMLLITEKSHVNALWLRASKIEMEQLNRR